MSPSEISKHPRIDRVLVIGPSGNIGRHLIPKLLELGYRVRALQFHTPVEPREGQEVVQGHTLDRESLDRAVTGVDAVIHMIRGSAGPGADACEKWFNCCLRGAVNVLEAVKDQPIKRLLNGSADNVFGHMAIPHEGPLKETSPRHFADGYYGLFKIAEDELCRQYHLGFGVPVTITRFPLIWTGQRLGNVTGVLDRENQRIRPRLDHEGKPLVRHDVHVEDAVRGVLLALTRDEAIGHDINFPGPAPYSSMQLAEMLSQHHDWPIEPQPSNWCSWTMDPGKATAMLGYQPRIELLEWLDERLGAENG